MTDLAAPVIHAAGLTKRFGELEAVKGIDLDVQPGEIFGFLGPNGAGKSTTINMLCTLMRPTGGTATVAGFDVDRQQADVRARIGLVFQDPSLDGQLTARENLQFHAFVYSVPSAERKAADRRGARDGRAHRSRERARDDLLGRDEAAARDRPRDAPHARGAVPRRADHRARSADPPSHLGVPPPPPRRGRCDPVHDDPLHGRGRRLRPDRDHRRRADRCAWARPRSSRRSSAATS